jgi:5'-methylthioadenosine phosphorylase
VGHVGFGDPFDSKLGEIIGDFESALKGGQDGVTTKLHTRKTEGKDLTLICMEGPAFSTRAESWLYRSWGGSVINMSCLPEAKLAKEAEISYQMICMSTDYDAWKVDEEPVTVETVVGNLKANSDNAHHLLSAVLTVVETHLKDGCLGNDLDGSMRYAISTAPAGQDPELKRKIQYLFPNYWN